MSEQVKVLMEKSDRKMFPVGKKWILVMDEDRAMRTEIRRMLEMSGFSVYTAGSIEDAVECYKVARVCGYPFSAVIMDSCVINAAGGGDAVKRLRDIDPDASVIVSGEDGEHPATERFKDGGFKGMLTKPFTSEELERTLNRVLYDNRGAYEKHPSYRR
jgi:two-component system cell cycle sensor histidine kinase/response regulator CckA